MQLTCQLLITALAVLSFVSGHPATRKATPPPGALGESPIISHDRFTIVHEASVPLLALTQQIFGAIAAAWSDLINGAGSTEKTEHYRPTSNPSPSKLNSTDVSSPVWVIYGDSDNGGATGIPDDPYADLAGYTHYNIAFYTIDAGAQDNAGLWARTDSSTQAHYKSVYNDAGIKLMVSAFGATDHPQSSGRSAESVATELADFVKNNNLDGIDIDYEEIDLFGSGQSLPWLVALQTSLRKQLPSPQYVISHAPLAPWFSWTTYSDGGYSAFDDQIGNTVDWYNVQFYNQGLYEDCNGLLFNSGGFAPDTSLFQINSLGGVPLSRLVVGKPATAQDADEGGSGYMSPSDLGSCLAQAKAKGYNAGLMYYEYPHATASKLATVKSQSGL